MKEGAWFGSGKKSNNDSSSPLKQSEGGEEGEEQGQQAEAEAEAEEGAETKKVVGEEDTKKEDGEEDTDAMGKSGNIVDRPSEDAQEDEKPQENGT